jgi:hypothetical protein
MGRARRGGRGGRLLADCIKDASEGLAAEEVSSALGVCEVTEERYEEEWGLGDG